MGLERGTVIGRIGGPGQGPYQLLEPVGAGRDTEVWRAESLRSGQIVAVKAYPRWYGGDRGYVQRFLRTAEASRQAQHPNLLPLLEAGEDDGHTFRVTPLVMGGSLEERLDGRPWSLTEALVVLEPLAAALDLLHGRGVVHGNVKPSNVLLDESERADAAAGRAASSLRRIGRPRLADPLIVRPVAASTAPGQFDLLLGSPTYASPEQASGTSLDTSTASDRYSLGVLAYHLLTGRPPFVGDTALALLLDHIVKRPPSACALNPELPADAERALTQMLAKDPVRRFSTCAAFVAALQEALSADARPRLLPAPADAVRSVRAHLAADQARGAVRTPVVAAAGSLQARTSWRCQPAWSAP